jgi:hypothetical protein
MESTFKFSFQQLPRLRRLMRVMDACLRPIPQELQNYSIETVPGTPFN